MKNFHVEQNDNVLLIEDVLTTGKSSIESIECINSLGGKVIGLISIVDRSEEVLKFDCPHTSLLKINAHFIQHDIPFELSKIPVSKPGSRFIK